MSENVRLGPLGWARWAWRRLTRMSSALVLLAIVALAAIPGGVLPQQDREPEQVAAYVADHPQLGSILARLGMFEVFTSPWFVACYLLLFISLIGCIIPRCAKYARALRAAPPRVPDNFEHLDVRLTGWREGSAEEAISALRRAAPRPYRVLAQDDGVHFAAVRGRLREGGNLVFHLGLVASLIALVINQGLAHGGQIVLVEEHSAANALVDYDSFTSGVLFDPARLDPFTLTLRSVTARFAAGGRPDFFEAEVAIDDRGERRTERIRVNAPAHVGGTGIYLMGNGYAPHVTVRDSSGEIAFAGAVPFLPRDAAYTSDGVIKVPDLPGDKQLGLAGQLFPTAVDTGQGYASLRPEPGAPLLVLQAYAGDLGLDGGVPQNVYRLDTSALTRLGEPIVLAPGQSAELAAGMGSITFDSLPRYAAFDLTASPGAGWLLTAIVVATAGLAVSLFTPRRRVFASASAADGGAHVLLAGSAEGSDAGVKSELVRWFERAEVELREAHEREEIATRRRGRQRAGASDDSAAKDEEQP